MSSIKGAPIMNVGYYDIPMNNQFSDREYRNKPIETTEYNINKKINTTINDNQGEYIVQHSPTIPSQSLYIESDQQTSPYYYADQQSLSSDIKAPLVKKKEMTPYTVESFHGGGGHGGGGGAQNLGGGGHPYANNPYQGSYIPMNGYGGYYQQSYLNTRLIPNVSRNYWGDEYEYTNYDYVGMDPGLNYTVDQAVPLMQPRPIVIQKKNNDDDDDETQIRIEDVKMLVEEEKNSKKKKKTKKAKKEEEKKSSSGISNKTLWLIIIVLSVIILLFIYKMMHDKKLIKF